MAVKVFFYKPFTQDASASLFMLALPASWLISLWSLLALAVNRLHDLNLPTALAIVLVIPAIAFLGWAFLALAPSKQQDNAHGSMPFPRQSS